MPGIPCRLIAVHVDPISRSPLVLYVGTFGPGDAWQRHLAADRRIEYETETEKINLPYVWWV